MLIGSTSFVPVSVISKSDSLTPYWLCESLLPSGVHSIHVQISRLLSFCCMLNLP